VLTQPLECDDVAVVTVRCGGGLSGHVITLGIVACAPSQTSVYALRVSNVSAMLTLLLLILIIAVGKVIGLMFVPFIIRRSRNNQHYAQICTTASFYILAPTCFGSSLPSSGSFWTRLSYMKIQINLVVYHIMLVKWRVCRRVAVPEPLLPKHVTASI
jgi:hypothetical protein